MSQITDPDDVSADLGGKFLKQSDFPNGAARVFTIASVDKQTFPATANREEETKWVVTFDNDRCLGLNRTNLALLAKWFGYKASAWAGQDVSVYVDESVSFGGRLVGGIRLRRPSSLDPKEAVDEIPF